MLPLVTVITPAYNCERFIEQTIKSVLSQACNIEYIVIDDCSTDGTVKILDKYEKDILLIKHEVNQGEQKTTKA
jgi:teichuronic acid biosynthesis glycosyltransferase TuaG